MSVVAIDLGGTKVSGAVFTEDGRTLHRETEVIAGAAGSAVGARVRTLLDALIEHAAAAGVAVPGIYHPETGTVWAPNIPGWDDYPLLAEVRESAPGSVDLRVDSDRACYILGESWQGAARGSRNAVFVAVGTGIGAGILADGRVLRCQRGIAGAVGWMALRRPHLPEYAACGCFEHHAAGPGIAAAARRLVEAEPGYRGPLRTGRDEITTAAVFDALAAGDSIADRVIGVAVECWGMALANLVSLLDPEVVIFGGGVFGPAARLLGRIREEAGRWAQPISMAQVRVEASRLGPDAGLIGAGRLALDALARRPHHRD